MAEIVQIISKLGIDSSEVFSELDKVNAKYKESTAEVRKQKDEIASLTKYEQGLMEQRSKTNNPTVVAQFNKEIDKTKEKIKSVTTELNNSSKAMKENEKEANKLKNNLDNAFDSAKPKSLKAQLRELKAELAATDDDEKFTELSVKAGKLEDRIQDAGTAARIFASDSKFEVVGNAIGNIGQKLLALDFAGALQGSQLLVKASSQISFKDALVGIKQLGQTLFNIGRALLTNPLFLIGAAVALIVINFDKLKNSGGAIGSVFKFIGAIIDGIVDSFFTLTDAIGITDKAATESAERIQKYYEALAESIEKTSDRIIKLQKAQGRETLQAEIDKNVKLSALNELAYFAYRDNLIRQGKTLDELSEEELKKIKEFGDKKADLNNDFAVILAEEEEKRSKASIERFKKAEEEKRAISKKIRDLEISNIADDAERAKATAVSKYNDEFALAKGNAQLIAELRIQLDNELTKIDKETNDKLLAMIDAQVKAHEDANQKIVDSDKEAKLKIIAQNESDLTETQRHVTALLEIKVQGNKDANIILLSNEIAFEKKRLEQLKESHGIASDEYIKQANKVVELEAKLVSDLNKIDKQRVQEVLSNAKIIVDAAIDSAQKIIDAEINKTDKLIALQQKRVDEVARIAENGNAELLELEKERLDKLTKEKEKFVRAQQVLATIELIANTAVTVSKAAAEGGAGAAFTIAAALIALIGGLASARSIAGQAAFYEGGYTGDGNPRDESMAIGKRPYIYHKGEFVHDHVTTKKYKKIFQEVHEGKLDLNKMKFESDMYKFLSSSGIDTSAPNQYRDLPSSNSDLSELKTEMGKINDSIKSQSRLKVSIDKDGIAMIATEYIKDRKRINTIAR